MPLTRSARAARSSAPASATRPRASILRRSRDSPCGSASGSAPTVRSVRSGGRWTTCGSTPAARSVAAHDGEQCLFDGVPDDAERRRARRAGQRQQQRRRRHDGLPRQQCVGRDAQSGCRRRVHYTPTPAFRAAIRSRIEPSTRAAWQCRHVAISVSAVVTTPPRRRTMSIRRRSRRADRRRAWRAGQRQQQRRRRHDGRPRQQCVGGTLSLAAAGGFAIRRTRLFGERFVHVSSRQRERAWQCRHRYDQRQ